MSGLSNANPIQETFLLGSRFSTKPSFAILLDSNRSQEYYEISESLFGNSKYDYDVVIFTAENSAPVYSAPCGVFYYNYFEQYNGNALALTLRGAINAFESGCRLKSKIWHISDITEFQMAQVTIPKLFEFFDHIYFVNDSVKSVFLNIFPDLNSEKIQTSLIKNLPLKNFVI